jgi:hypothetical protein
MQVLFVVAILLTIALVVWARRVWRRHDEESIYEPDSRSESHKKDPFFQEHFGDHLH